jgi:CRISPR/Cas system-associated exonuclease Cas4 (RecB family)
VWTENKNPRQLPRSPEAILGTVVHRIFELTSRGLITSLEEFEKKWDEELDFIEKKLQESNIEKRLVPIKSNVRDFEVKKELCRLQVSDNLKLKRGRINEKEAQFSVIAQEKQLIIPEKSVKGIVDLVIKKGDYIEIIDYKNGNIFENVSGERKVKERIITQLIFYSGLYFFCYGVWPTKLSVMDNLGKRVNIPYSPSDAKDLIDSAQSMSFSLNSVIDNASISESEKKNLFARPSPTSCKYCNYRPSCNAYICKKMTDRQTRWPTDLFVKIIRIDKSKSGLITISGHHIDTDKNVRIVNIPKEYLESLSTPGRKISFFNVRPHFNTLDIFEWQQNSIFAVFPSTETFIK